VQLVEFSSQNLHKSNLESKDVDRTADKDESLRQAGPKRSRPGVTKRGKETRERELWYIEKGNGNKEGRGSEEVWGIT
jgi:hypothetical protein